jgi:hypothetical protein
MATYTSRRGLRTALVALALSLLTTACANQPTGPVQTSETPSTPSTLNRYGAPPVTNPLDATSFLTHPCAALTPVQLQGLDLLGPGEPDTDSSLANYSGPTCSWHNAKANHDLGVTFMTGNKNGLADLYRGHDQGQFPGYWIETDVDGYPGVFSDLADGRKDGFCTLHVGISDTLAVLIDRHDGVGEKSCDEARAIASLVLRTIQAGG